MEILSCAIFSTLLPIFLCKALPPTALSAAPIAVAESSGVCEQVDDEPDAGKPRSGFLNRMVGLFERGVALEVLVHHDRTHGGLSRRRQGWRLVRISLQVWPHVRDQSERLVPQDRRASNLRIGRP